jgi:hypothetical protein
MVTDKTYGVKRKLQEDVPTNFGCRPVLSRVETTAIFANEQYQLIPTWKAATLETKLRTDDVLQVRERIWQEDGILDRFTSQNPAHLPDTDLALVQSWKYRRQGDFLILKELKKHAILLPQDHFDDVLAVKGLYSRFSEIFPYFPILVKAVLLPYEGEIIGDGLYSPYNVTFGSGMVGEWNAIYADAKERGEILTSLTGSAQPISSEEKAKKAEATNRKVITDFEKQLLRASSSLKIVERDLATVRQLAQVSLEDRGEPHSLRDLTEKEYSAYLDGLPADARHTAEIGLKRFVQFMRDTGRMDWDEAENMLMVVKR